MANDTKSLAQKELDKISSSVEENFDDDFNDGVEDIAEDYIYKENAESLNTHQKIKKSLVGNIILLEKGHSKTALKTNEELVVDTLGLIHNGFIASAAEFAAVAAINEENIVVISSKAKFLAPAKNGDLVEFDAIARFEDARKREVKVIGEINEIKIFEGIFQAVVLEKHILKTKLKNIKKNYHTK